MSLSIYSIKHPLVLNWTSSIFSSKVSNYQHFQFLNKIGVALIYEATRKSLETINLSIKEIDEYRGINILPNQLSYIIFIDLYLSQVLSKDIYSILPNTTVHPIYSRDASMEDIILRQEQLLDKVLDKSKEKKIIIFTEHLNTDYTNSIIKTIQYKNYKYSKLQICCITCSTRALQLINTQEYEIDIYTAKIVDKNKK